MGRRHLLFNGAELLHGTLVHPNQRHKQPPQRHGVLQIVLVEVPESVLAKEHAQKLYLEVKEPKSIV